MRRYVHGVAEVRVGAARQQRSTQLSVALLRQREPRASGGGRCGPRRGAQQVGRGGSGAGRGLAGCASVDLGRVAELTPKHLGLSAVAVWLAGVRTPPVHGVGPRPVGRRWAPRLRSIHLFEAPLLFGICVNRRLALLAAVLRFS
jgi:hypothetical protein